MLRLFRLPALRGLEFPPTLTTLFKHPIQPSLGSPDFNQITQDIDPNTSLETQSKIPSWPPFTVDHSKRPVKSKHESNAFPDFSNNHRFSSNQQNNSPFISNNNNSSFDRGQNQKPYQDRNADEHRHSESHKHKHKHKQEGDHRNVSHYQTDGYDSQESIPFDPNRKYEMHDFQSYEEDPRDRGYDGYRMMDQHQHPRHFDRHRDHHSHHDPGFGHPDQHRDSGEGYLSNVQDFKPGHDHGHGHDGYNDPRYENTEFSPDQDLDDPLGVKSYWKPPGRHGAFYTHSFDPTGPVPHTHPHRLKHHQKKYSRAPEVIKHKIKQRSQETVERLGGDKTRPRYPGMLNDPDRKEYVVPINEKGRYEMNPTLEQMKKVQESQIDAETADDREIQKLARHLKADNFWYFPEQSNKLVHSVKAFSRRLGNPQADAEKAKYLTDFSLNSPESESKRFSLPQLPQQPSSPTKEQIASILYPDGFFAALAKFEAKFWPQSFKNRNLLVQAFTTTGYRHAPHSKLSPWLNPRVEDDIYSPNQINAKGVWRIPFRKKAEPLHFDNERLEFLGDTLLRFVIASWATQQYPYYNPNNLTRLVNHLSSNRTLRHLAEKHFRLVPLILDRETLGSPQFKRAQMEAGTKASYDEDSKLFPLIKRRADAVEALAAATFFDRGLEAASAFILQHIIRPGLDILASYPDKHIVARFCEAFQLKYKKPPRFFILRDDYRIVTTVDTKLDAKFDEDTFSPPKFPFKKVRHVVIAVEHPSKIEPFVLGEGATIPLAREDAAYHGLELLDTTRIWKQRIIGHKGGKVVQIDHRAGS